MNRLCETWYHGQLAGQDFTRKGWNSAPSGITVGFHGGSTFDVRVLWSSADMAWYNYDPAFGGSGFGYPAVPMSSKVTWGFHSDLGYSSYGTVAALSCRDVSGNVIVGIGVNSSNGVITAYRGGIVANISSGTSIGSSAAGAWPLGPGVHMYEMQVYRHASAGTVEVRVDGITVLNLSGVNTAGGTTDIAGCQWYSSSSYTQDHYVNDDTGSSPTGFVGDIRNEMLLPSANGAHTDFTPSTGTNHASMVNDVPVTSGYNFSNVSGAKDSYVMSDLVTVAASAIPVVRLNALFTKQETPRRGVKPFTRVGGVDSALGVETLSPNPFSVVWAGDAFPTNPSGGAWSISDVNGIEAGWDIST